MRDNKVLESFKKKIEKNLKEMNIFKNLRQEVSTKARLLNENIREHIS
jgi:hypothetical protein